MQNLLRIFVHQQLLKLEDLWWYFKGMLWMVCEETGVGWTLLFKNFSLKLMALFWRDDTLILNKLNSNKTTVERIQTSNCTYTRSWYGTPSWQDNQNDIPAKMSNILLLTLQEHSLRQSKDHVWNSRQYKR